MMFKLRRVLSSRSCCLLRFVGSAIAAFNRMTRAENVKYTISQSLTCDEINPRLKDESDFNRIAKGKYVLHDERTEGHNVGTVVEAHCAFKIRGIGDSSKDYCSQVTTIEPYVLIEHNCGYEGLSEKTTFFYYLDPDYIVEGNSTRKSQNLGEIELITHDAPVQDFKKKHYSHRHILHSQRERIDQCIPLYVTYRDFFENEVFGNGQEVVKVLPTDDPDLEIIAEEPTPTIIDDPAVEEIVRIHEDIKNIEKLEEENLKKLIEEGRKLEEDHLRMEEERKREEQRKIEEEKERIREEERRRREEEERRRDEERRKAEEERQKEEERRKQEYEKAMEEYRRREEERRQEILRREEEAKREKDKVQPVNFEDEDDFEDLCYRRIKRGVKLDANDPCYRRLKG